MKHVLFVCGRNRLRSPTAEAIFSGRDDIAVAAAGVSSDADTPVDAELLEWADVVFVMEKSHREKLTARFRAALKNTRIVCLDIPDNFAFMDPELIRLLKAKAGPLL
jgi:predicted protein tyrosine phosphatase